MHTKVRTSILALAVIAGSAAMANSYGASFAYSPKVGDVMRYKSTAKFNMSGMDGTATFTDRQKVTAVEDGVVTIESTQEDGMILIMGQEMPMGTLTGVLKMKMNGVVTSAEGDDGFGDMRMANIGSFIRPDKEVEQGDSWTHKFPGDTKVGTVNAEATFKYIGEENALNEAAYKVEFEYKETEGTYPASSKGTFWISKANGQVLKSVATWKDVPVAGAPEPINADVTTELMK